MDANKRITKVVNLKIKLKDTFRAYLEFIKPVHKMRKQEIDVLGLLMYYNYNELDNFKYEEDRWRKVFDTSTKQLIMKELNMNNNVFQNTLTALRKKGAVIKENGVNKIAKNYLPAIDKDTGIYTLSISFHLK